MPVRYSLESSGPSTRRAQPAGGTSAEFTLFDYAAMTKAQLRALAEERGAATSGTKDDLIARLSK